MFARALLVTLQQAVRSIALLLFPLTFISLIAWATAGSATGNTSDPIRASLWLWLGAHQIHFNLSLAPAHVAGTLSALPLGAVVFPFLAARNGFRRSAEVLENSRAARIFFIFWYCIFATLFALISRSDSISADLFYTVGATLVITLLASLDYSSLRLSEFKFPLHSILFLISLSLLISGGSLAAHYKIVHDITVVDQPGWVGGAILLILQIAYLPNVALTSLSYFLGSGFTLGSSTLITPIDFTLHGIPAIPLMGGLPTGKHPLALIGIALVFIIIAINILRIRKFHERYRARHARAIVVGCFFTAALTLLAFLSSGELLTSHLDPVGPRYAYLTAYSGALWLIAIFLFISLPGFFSWLRNRKKLEVEEE